jgi:hypothetical protein
LILRLSAAKRSTLSRPIPTLEISFNLEAAPITLFVICSVPAMRASKSLTIPTNSSSLSLRPRGLIKYSIPAASSCSIGRRLLSQKGTVVIKTLDIMRANKTGSTKDKDIHFGHFKLLDLEPNCRVNSSTPGILLGQT